MRMVIMIKNMVMMMAVMAEWQREYPSLLKTDTNADTDCSTKVVS